jgi:hypothetical protein
MPARSPENSISSYPPTGVSVTVSVKVRINSNACVAMGMASLGINPHTISLVLDHISATKGTVTGAVYGKHSFDREKREAPERWATHLSNLLV